MHIWHATLALLRQTAGRFWKRDSGMTLPLMALSMAAVIGLIGLATDLARVQMAQSKLQGAVDSAGLAGAVLLAQQPSSTSTTSTSATPMSAYAQQILFTNFSCLSHNEDDQGQQQGSNQNTGNATTHSGTCYLGSSWPVTSLAPNANNTKVIVSATSNVPTTFFAVVGLNQIQISASSQVTESMSGLELVMVLDNTGSMNNNGKMAALKIAATTLLKTIAPSGALPANVYVGIVPFSQTVNIGTDTVAQSWLDSNWDSAQHFVWPPAIPWAGCVDARVTMTPPVLFAPGNGSTTDMDITDDPPNQSNAATLFHQYYYPCTYAGNQWLHDPGGTYQNQQWCRSECEDHPNTYPRSKDEAPIHYCLPNPYALQDPAHPYCCCDFSNVYWNTSTGSCQACPSGSYYNSTAQQCQCDSQHYLSSSNTCVPYCTGAGQQWNGSQCVCNGAYNTVSTSPLTCSAKCTSANSYWNGNSCVCGGGYQATGSNPLVCTKITAQ